MALLLHVPQQHGEPEHVYVADNVGNVYEDTLANFALDYGQEFPVLPVGNVGREYEPGVRHFVYSTDLVGTDLELAWVDGDVVINVVGTIAAAKEVRLTPPEPVLTLDEIKVLAKNIVDATAETARARYITSGDGQSMAYLEKAEEAADFVAAGYPADLSNYPFIQAEVNATGGDQNAVADTILAQRSAWITIGAAVEEIRLGAKKSITEAADEAAVTTAKDAAVVALEAI